MKRYLITVIPAKGPERVYDAVSVGTEHRDPTDDRPRFDGPRIDFATTDGRNVSVFGLMHTVIIEESPA